MSAYELVTDSITFSGSGTFDTYTLTAPAGKKPVAGGIKQTVTGGSSYAILLESYPSGNDWHFTVTCNSSVTTATLYLVCLPTYTITAD